MSAFDIVIYQFLKKHIIYDLLLIQLLLILVIKYNILPPFTIYLIWFINSIIISIMVNISTFFKSLNKKDFIFIIITVLTLSSIIHINIPLTISDNFASTPETIHLSQITNRQGKLPQIIEFGYVDYPGSILILSIITQLSSLKPVLLVKFLGVILPIFIVIFTVLLKNKTLLLVSAIIIGFNPWVYKIITHYTPVAVAAVFVILYLILLYRHFYVNNNTTIIISILTISIIITNVTMGFILLIFHVGLLFTKTLLNKIRFSIRDRNNFLIIFNFCILLIWYLIASEKIYIINFIKESILQVLFGYNISVKPIYPSSERSLLIIYAEYLTFISLICYSLYSIYFYLKRKEYVYILFFGGGIFSAIVIIIPWITGFEQGTDLVSRSVFIFQASMGIVISPLICRLNKKKRSYRLMNIFFLSLLIMNALLYGVDPYRYDNDYPLVRDDSRFNLVEWKAVCSYMIEYNNKTIWTVRLGKPFLQGVRFNELVPGVSLSTPPVQYSDLLRLNKRLKHSVVLLRRSMDSVPEWPNQYYSINKVLHINNIVYSSIDAFILDIQ